MLREQWQKGGVGGGQNHYQLTRVEAVENEYQAKSFLTKARGIHSRSVKSDGPFEVEFVDTPQDPPASHIIHDPKGEKRAVLHQLKDRFIRKGGQHPTGGLLAFHGCSHRAADDICRRGFPRSYTC